MRKLILSVLCLAAACGSEDETNNVKQLDSAAIHGAPHKLPDGSSGNDVDVAVSVNVTSDSSSTSDSAAMTDGGTTEAPATETEATPETETAPSDTGSSGGAPSEGTDTGTTEVPTDSGTGGGGGGTSEFEEPTECDPVACALNTNACYIFYCSGTNPWCFSAYRDDDWDGAASCPGEVYGDYGRDTYPGAYDCNDYNAAVRPGNAEICADALDNDCDGQMDSEDSECVAPTEEIPTEEPEGGSESGGGSEGGDGSDMTPPSVTPGTYECEVSPDTPRANIILASATTRVLTVRCKAHGEDVRMDTFNVDILGNFAAVVQVNLSVVDGTSWTAAHTDGKVQFGYVGLILPKEEWTYLYVDVVLHDLWPTYPISSGDTVQLVLGPNKGIGQESGEAIYFTPSDPAPTGNEMVIRSTRPTISFASGSPSGAGIPGMGEVQRTNVCADSRGDVYLDQVAFQLESTDVGSTTWNDCETRNLGSATKWELYDVDDPATKLDADTAWTFLEGDGTTCEFGDNLKYAILRLDGLFIPAGDCRTLVLRVDSSGANSANDNTLRVDIPLEVATDTFDSINWCDDDLACGINGEFIRNLPVIGGTILF